MRARSPRFAVQQRAGRRVSYDLHLEANGVLRSWVLPRAFSMDPREKRLAMPTGENPREHADFEGVVPGAPGGGAVIVWDRGVYRNLTRRNGSPVPVEQALADGHAVVWLEGQKLRGGYELTRVAGAEREHWLIVKRRDEEAHTRPDPASTAPESVLSGKTLWEIAEAR